MNKRSRIAALLLLALLSTTLTGCSVFSRLTGSIGSIFTPNHQNDMAQWQVRTEKEAREYEKSRYVVVELMPDGSDQRKRGIVSDLQYAEFNTYERNVAAAEEHLNADFKLWASSGTKPPSFDGHAATVREWQNKLINLVKAVKP